MTLVTQRPTLTAKQRERLAELEDKDVRVTGWDAKRRGPVVTFATGAHFVITRDGGLDG